MPNKSHYSIPNLKESIVGRWSEHEGESTVPKASFGGVEKYLIAPWRFWVSHLWKQGNIITILVWMSSVVLAFITDWPKGKKVRTHKSFNFYRTTCHNNGSEEAMLQKE